MVVEERFGARGVREEAGLLVGGIEDEVFKISEV
jgi:hypothetical protein